MTRTVVMIHGMWGGGWYWRPFRSVLEPRGWHCMAPDLRHHNCRPGDPPHPDLGSTSLLDYAADLEALISGLGENPIIIGHSMGGLLAQMLAARNRARAAVLLTSASPAGILALKPSVLWSFSNILLRWGFWKRPHRMSRAKAVYSMLQLLPPNEQRATHDRFVHESGRAASEIGFWFFDRRHANRVDESRVTCPVLVIGGARDRITPVSISRKIARKYRTVSTYHELSDHAHWMVSEPGWEDVAGLVATWLEETIE